jgi:hypothetical protein
MTLRKTTDLYNFFNKTAGNVFHIPVSVPTPHGPTRHFFALVDTGADDLVIPDAFITDFYPSGAAAAPSSAVLTASGSTSLPIFRSHTFTVDGVSVTSDVVFAPIGHSAALCGRVPLMACSGKFGLRKLELLRD